MPIEKFKYSKKMQNKMNLLTNNPNRKNKHSKKTKYNKFITD